jgi:hypothetical protein
LVSIVEEIATSEGEEEELKPLPQRAFRPEHKFPIQDPNAVYLLRCFHSRCKDLEAALEMHNIPIPEWVTKIDSMEG